VNGHRSKGNRGVQLLLLAAAMSSANYARTALSPFQEKIRLALSLTDNEIGVLQGPAMALPVVLGAVPLGLLIDRSSRTRLLLIFTVLNAAGTVWTACATHFAALLAARCVVGFTASAISITVLALLADFYTPTQRGRATMVVTFGEVGGASAAFGLGGVLLGTFTSTQNGWQPAMFWLSVPLALIIVLMLALREPLPAVTTLQRASAGVSFSTLWRYRAVLAPLLVAKIMVVTSYSAVLIWAAPTLSRNFGLSPARIGTLMAMSLLVSGLLGPMAGGLVADFCQRTGGPRRTMLALSVLALLNVPAACFGLMTQAEEASVLLVLFMTIASTVGVTEMTLATVVIPAELRGLCLSVLVAAGLIFGIGLAPVAVSLLSGAMGGPQAIGYALSVTCITTSIVGAAAFALGRPYFPRNAVS
jgi:predicted MFS family arabinose efflux permease